LRYEATKLVAGIDHGERLASFGHAVAREEVYTFGCGELFRIESKMPGKRLVQSNETGRSHGGGRKPRIELLRQARVAVVEGKEIGCFGL
jgi:hypothetical protein